MHDQTSPPLSTDKGLASRCYEAITALSMTVGRGAAARTIADVAAVGAGDRLVDIGCGPGTAVREAARRGAASTGVDPSPLMLDLARRISFLRGVRYITWVEGSAEAIPVPDGAASVAWALSSVHHWVDRPTGLAEASRALVPGGRLVLAERLARPGARGHAAHGLTRDQADELAAELGAAGFVDIRIETRGAGRRALLVVRGIRPGPKQ
jgi:ubiquinone/menaquinone biosynthesis C-methylase UbiE